MPGPVFKLNVPDDRHKIQPLPAPSGTYPFHMQLGEEIAGLPADKMVFHLAGDTGSVRLPSFQKHIAREMSRQFNVPDAADKPQFMFHLGDVVYNYGAEDQYYDQFFKPFSVYPAPIFAIPGNHDAAIDPFRTDPSATLAAYLKVFCSKEKTILPIAGETGRLTITEPNTYWTLEAPLATIIGMYTNVNKFGYVDEQQKDWLVSELQKAAAIPGKAVILCMHHSAYSGDSNHGASEEMILMLDECFGRAGCRPDIVFSGHVHNYQRFIKTYDDGAQLPFIVAGAGGYAELHTMAVADDPYFTNDSPLFNGVVLHNHCDACHGFMKLSITRGAQGLLLDGSYYTVNLDVEGVSFATMKDEFQVVVNR